MTTRMPAARHSVTAAGTVGRSGSARPTRAQEIQREDRAASAGRAASPGSAARATPSTRMPCPAMSSIDRAMLGAIGSGEPAERRRWPPGAPLVAADSVPSSLGPDVGDRQQLGAQAIFPFECQTAIRIAIRGEDLGAERDEGLFHRIERFARAGEDAVSEQLPTWLSERRLRRPAAKWRHRPAARRPSSGFASACRSCRCTAPSRRRASRSRDTRRVSTRAREMRHAPMTMKTVSTSGNSSGSIDMPSAMPLKHARRASRRAGTVKRHREHAEAQAYRREAPNETARSRPEGAAARSRCR